MGGGLSRSTAMHAWRARQSAPPRDGQRERCSDGRARSLHVRDARGIQSHGGTRQHKHAPRCRLRPAPAVTVAARRRTGAVRPSCGRTRILGLQECNFSTCNVWVRVKAASMLACKVHRSQPLHGLPDAGLAHLCLCRLRTIPGPARPPRRILPTRQGVRKELLHSDMTCTRSHQWLRMRPASD